MPAHGLKAHFGDFMVPESEYAPAPAPVVDEKDIIYPRLGPAAGRTIELDENAGRDIVRGLAILGSLVHRNKVKQDFNKQRYHERPGLKRKRLKSVR